MSLKKADNILVLLLKQFLKKIIYWAGLCLCRCSVFSLAVASGGHSLVAVRGLLIVVASFAVEHGL